MPDRISHQLQEKNKKLHFAKRKIMLSTIQSLLQIIYMKFKHRSVRTDFLNHDKNKN